MSYHLAQVNIAYMRAPLSDPIMAEFVAQLHTVNAAADASPGFVWRLQTEQGNATEIRAYEDERILFNLSVWQSLEALKAYVYRSQHGAAMRDRRKWFEPNDQPTMALWWIPAGQIPSVAEAKARLDYLRQHGSTPHAFLFNHVFAVVEAATNLL
jgi:heme-degrading monooxygenase HmoA